MIIPITFTITTCNRLDLLEKTLTSFSNLNKYPIDEYIMSDDSGSSEVFDFLKNTFGDKFKILQNNPKIGLAKSIDRLFSEAKNEYIFHCEDDWFFEGNPNFINDSLTILENNKNIHHVWIRHEDDLAQQYLASLNFNEDSIVEFNNIKYKQIPIIEHWNGFSYNPGLRRKSNYITFFPDGVAAIGDESDCAKYTASFNYKSVLLNNTSCYHIGYDKRTENFIH